MYIYTCIIRCIYIYVICYHWYTTWYIPLYHIHILSRCHMPHIHIDDLRYITCPIPGNQLAVVFGLGGE